MWCPQGIIELIDLQNEYIWVRIIELQDYARVLNNGPWIILGHYLTIKRWKPEFCPYEDTI